MKIILSRKGVDSSSGGFASPIFSNDRLLPIPIPDTRSPLRYKDLQWDVSSGQLVKHLSHNRLNGWSRVHLDPDLCSGSLHRKHGFTAAFGQCGAAQSHLSRYGIGAGDLFLFFGWFRRVERYHRRFRYVRDAPDLHVIFGWLQIDCVVSVDDVACSPQHKRLQDHPHCFGNFAGQNMIYRGRDHLTFDKSMPGAGHFNSVTTMRTLTAEGCNRSLWEVPEWMHPNGRDSVLSYHDDRSRWQRTKGKTLLRSVARGQEFILDTRCYPEALGWVGELFSESDGN